MNKECNKIEKKLSDYLNTLYKKSFKKLNTIINIGLIILTMIILMMFISQIGGFHNLQHHLLNVLFILLLMIGIKIVITFMNKWIFGSKYSVIDIVEISGYIKKYNETMYIPNIGSTTLTYYYFDLVNSSEVPTTLIISPLQNHAIQRMLNNNPSHKIYTYKVAILEPKSAELINKTLRDGTLLLLPLEEFFTKENGLDEEFNSDATFEDDTNSDPHISYNSEYRLKIKNKDTWYAPEQYNHQPSFTVSRSEIKPDKQYHLICEDKISHKMDFIPFKPSKIIKDVNLINQFDEPEYEDMNIEDVVYYAHEEFHDFQDFRTRSEPVKNVKGPNFLGFCLISYAINCFLFGFLLNEQTPGFFFALNLLITATLFIAIIKVTFFPLFVKTPVRFHRKNKEIYVHINNSLYKIPWEKSDISIIVKQNKITTNYYLTLWLDPKYDVNNNSEVVVPFTLFSSEDIHGKVYFFWDYINRYMKYADPFSVKKQKKQLKAPEKKENKTISTQLFDLLIFIIFLPILIMIVFSDHNELRRVLNPFKQKWPSKVHEWTEKVCNWH